MKYATSKYDVAIVEAEDILTASQSQPVNYEAWDNKDGNIIMDALNIFK